MTATAISKREVVIVQRYVAHYRVPLFELLRERLLRDDIRLRVLAGAPDRREVGKRDQGTLDWVEPCPQRYLLEGRICWQPFGALVTNADLVILPQQNRLAYNAVAIALGLPKRVAFWGHGVNFQRQGRQPLRTAYRRYLARKVDWWFAYTEASVAAVRDAGVPPARITDLQNAIDVDALRRDVESIDAAELEARRCELGLAGGRVALYMGSLYAEKRIDFLLRAAERLHERDPAFRLLVAGEGPQGTMVSNWSRTRPWARPLGVRFGRDKAVLLKLAEVLLNPGLVGLGILDAFAAGIPILTTDCGLHSPEISYLRDGENGLMTPDTLVDFVDTVGGLFRNATLREKLAAGARRDADRYTVGNMANRFAEGINGALALPVSGRGAV